MEFYLISKITAGARVPCVTLFNPNPEERGFGISAEVLNEGQAAVLDVEAKLAAQLKEKGEAQNATVARDQALEDLMDWMTDFFAISRIAMEATPQYLETLGIVEPS